MQSNTPRNTKPETALRAALHREGLRFRKHHRPFRSERLEIDVAFTSVKLAVFVDGCFWHGCPIHATFPRTNASWWSTKLARNRERDVRFGELLREGGWTILRIWEHEPLPAAVQSVVLALRELRDTKTP
jgi:DNA mismatch endonuclease (patch repair protein)